jgi:hypothetical protein
MIPITLKLEEAVIQYTFKDTKQQQVINLDQDIGYRHWPHPAKAISIQETQNHEEATISAYTDGSKHQGGVGSGIVIYKGRDNSQTEGEPREKILKQPSGASSYIQSFGRD